MAADANLIKGAAAAYGAGTAAKQAGGNQLGAMAQNLLGRVDNRTADLKKRTEEAKERDRVKQAKFNENSEAALQQGGALGEAEYDFTKRKVDALQKEYQQCTLGDDACRQKVMMALSKESQGLTTMKDTRKLNAESMLNLRGDVSAEQQEVMGIYANSQSGKYSMVEGTDGELRYTFDLGEGKEAAYTKGELDKMFEAQKDTVGTNETKKRSLANIELGKTGEPFNPTQEESAFDTLTKTDNSLRSFLNDDWGVGTFAGSIEEKIRSEVGQLGAGSGRATFAYDMQKRGVMIPAAEGETNWYDNITDEDIQAIKAKLMNPETEEEIAISRQVSKEYYVDAQKQQYDKGVNEANNSRLAEQKKILDKENFEILKGNIKSKLQKENNAAKRGDIITSALIKEGEEKSSTKVKFKEGSLTMPNLDPNKADDGTENTISYDVAYAKDIGNKVEDESFTGGFAGQQMNRYYYKDNKGEFRQYESKEEFIQENNLANAIEEAGSVDDRDESGRVVYNEEQQQIIANFKAAPGGLNGGKQINKSTLRTDEGIDAAQDEVITETTSSRNTYLEAERAKQYYAREGNQR